MNQIILLHLIADDKLLLTRDRSGIIDAGTSIELAGQFQISIHADILQFLYEGVKFVQAALAGRKRGGLGLDIIVNVRLQRVVLFRFYLILDPEQRL